MKNQMFKIEVLKLNHLISSPAKNGSNNNACIYRANIYAANLAMFAIKI